MLVEQPRLARTDVELLALHCRQAGTFERARAEVLRDGLTVTGSNGGQIKHPSQRIAESAATEMRALLIALGCSPTSRDRVQKLPDVAPDSAWDVLDR